MKYYAEYNSPVGTLYLAEDDGFVTDVSTTCPSGAEAGETAVLGTLARQLGEYFSGTRRSFDEIPAAPGGTAFQRQVYAELTNVPYGQTRTYGQIARAVGRSNAFRAVGQANHRNPIWILIPCHRIIGADGSLTGYGGGMEMKKFLLELERKSAHNIT